MSGHAWGRNLQCRVRYQLCGVSWGCSYPLAAVPKALSLRPARLLPGFRRYDRIVETLIHELAHMVHGDHDDAFKQLNSQLRAEAAAADWRGAAARRLEGAGRGRGGRAVRGMQPGRGDVAAA